MRRLLSTMDRWGPAVLSVLSLFVLCGMGWIYSAQIARLEGKVEILQDELTHRVQLESSLRSEVQIWQAYTVRLQGLMIQNGIKGVPSPPIQK